MTYDEQEPVVLHEITWDNEANWYARGHVEPQAFAIAIASEIGGEAEVLVARVKHLWGRWRPARGDFDRWLMMAKPGSPGAFRLTMIEDWYERVQAERRKAGGR